VNTYRTNQELTLTWDAWAFRKFTVPKGAVCEPALNLPADSEGRPQFWLKEVPQELRRNAAFLYEFEVCGFLVPAEAVSPSGKVLEAYQSFIK
jgi:hypothetical protein